MITLGIINYNLPHHVYYLIESIKKQCKFEYEIVVFDAGQDRPIINHVDNVTILRNRHFKYFDTTDMTGLQVYNHAVEELMNYCKSDDMIIIDNKSLVKGDLTKFVAKAADAIVDQNYTMIYLNMKKLREAGVKAYINDTDQLYSNILKGDNYATRSSNNLITVVDHALDDIKFIEWIMANKHLWTSEYYDVIVSFTTFRGRIYDATTLRVISALVKQATQFKYKVVMVLSREELGNNFDMPPGIQHIIDDFPNFEVLWTDKDTKPLKKLDPTMEKYPNIPIITLDDDDLCDPFIVEHMMTEHILDPFYALGTWMEPTPNMVRWVAGVRLWPPHCLYKFPLEDYYTYYDGILDDNFNAMRCAYKMTPVKEVSFKHNQKLNQTDLKLAREYMKTPWDEYYKRFVLAHLDEVPEELYYE